MLESSDQNCNLTVELRKIFKCLRVHSFVFLPAPCKMWPEEQKIKRSQTCTVQNIKKKTTKIYKKKNKQTQLMFICSSMFKPLQVFIHNGWTNIDSNYELCLRREDVTLPKEGYFGVTAATGGLAGNGPFPNSVSIALFFPLSNQTPRDTYL